MSSEQEEILGRRTSLGNAVSNNDAEWCRTFADHMRGKVGFPTPDEFTTLLFKSKTTLEPEIVDFLIENGADINKKFDIQLPDRIELVGFSRLAILNNQTELVKHIIEKGYISIDERSVGGDSLLSQALGTANLDLANWLNERGAKIDATNFLGFTALHRAATNVQFEAVEWLLARGANPELETLEGSVASQLIPTADETGECDMLFDILEDYSATYVAGSPEVPQALTDKVKDIRSKREAEQESSQEPQVQVRAPRR